MIKKAQMGLSLLPADSPINPINNSINSSQVRNAKIQEYKRRLKILRLNGYKNVPLNGSWGKWQQSLWNDYNQKRSTKFSKYTQYLVNGIGELVLNAVNSAKPFLKQVKAAVNNPSKTNVAATAVGGVKTMLDVGMSPISTVILKIPVVSSILPYADLTHTSAFFNPNYHLGDGTYLNNEYENPLLNNSIGLALYFLPIRAGKYGKNVVGRYKELKTNVPKFRESDFIYKDSPFESYSFLNSDGLPETYYYNSNVFPNNLYQYNEGNMIQSVPVISRVQGQPNTSFHFNIARVEETAPGVYVSHPNPVFTMREALRLQKKLPSGYVLTSNGEALSKALYLQQSSPMTKAQYVITGRVRPPKEYIYSAYSTDIPNTLYRLQDKGLGTVEVSPNSRINKINILGETYLKYLDLLPPYNPYNFSIDLSLMTPEQISAFNKAAAQDHLYIDPTTKTMDNLIFIKK